MKKHTPAPTKPETIAFSIENMDTMGQGVFRNNGSVGFIAKTLPGESGTARTSKRSKGVTFAKLISLTQASPKRIAASCEHFDHCPGCHYLHTDYTQELAYKEQALQQLLRKLSPDNANIEVIAAPQRLHYRNRMQLHYRGDHLGLIDADNNRIISIPKCQLLREELQQPLANLYANKEWKHESKREGHVELYLKDDQVSVQWNQPYAHGGFTQVYDAMNTKLCQRVDKALDDIASKKLLDIFAGNGNLSNAYCERSQAERLMIDVTPHKHPDFLALDLFSDTALAQFKRHKGKQTFDTLLVDPPRKGFAELPQWIEASQAKHLIYVSCNPATLARDLQLVPGLNIQHIALLDLFPGTYHFETLVIATMGKNKKRS